MRNTLRILAIAGALAAPVLVSRPAPAEAVAATKPAASRLVEVCFVLDTTGSMSGLIDGAKKKIWSIANSIIAADPKAKVRFALVPYRDRGDDYVTRVFDLTDDLDKVFADLQSFEAGGGGDGPESVNQALDEAVSKVAWTSDGETAKFIFLVGDFPPHMDYPDDVKFPKTCEAAVKKNLIINTVQCGDQSETAEIWREIARRGEGTYVALEQSGGMIAVDTPMDGEIAELSAQIGALAVPYGSVEQQREVASKTVAAASAPAAVQADRAYFNTASGKAIQGRGDLISDVRESSVALDAIPDAELPENMRAMSAEQRVEYLKAQGEKRDALNARVAELSKQRQAYIAEQNRKLPASADAFDAKVSETVKMQLERKR